MIQKSQAATKSTCNPPSVFVVSENVKTNRTWRRRRRDGNKLLRIFKTIRTPRIVVLLVKVSALATCTLIFAGCIAGKMVAYYPQAGVYKCGNFTIQLNVFHSDGFMIAHYIVPLAPIFNESETASDLEVTMLIYSTVEPVFDLSLEDLEVRVPTTSTTHYPYKKTVTANVQEPAEPRFAKSFKFFFDANRHDVNEFSLVFRKRFQACEIPEVVFKKKESTHIATPLNK